MDRSVRNFIAANPSLFGGVTELELVSARLVNNTWYVRYRQTVGGIPVLFPIAGRLADDKYQVDGVTYTMKQHGFARGLPWAIVDQATDGGARLGLALTPNHVTRPQYPFDFRLAITYVLFRISPLVERALGHIGIVVLTRLFGILLAALSVQFVLDGLRDYGLVPG